MKFEINDQSIETSFDILAKELLTNHILDVNGQTFEFTEIEFYYYKKGVHEDISVHPHKRDAGEWRAHRSGLDITFAGNDTQDGGILIRGIKCGNNYINGPLRVLRFIFQNMGSVNTIGSIQLKKKVSSNKTLPIFKTTRHGLGKSVEKNFKLKLYRYFVDLDNWNNKHVSKKDKHQILQASKKLTSP